MRRVHITAWAGAVIAALIAGCAGTAGRDGGAEIEKAMAGSHRSEANRARDVYRHPKETLQFFGVRPDSTVVEIWPGGGWYTEILAPLLRDRGRYYAAHFHVTEKSPKYMGPARANFLKMMASRPEVYDRVTVTALEAPVETGIAPRGSADIVLTFRNVHNWTAAKNDEAMFKAFYEV